MEMGLNQISTAALAYLGDSVLEVAVRRMLVERGLSSSRRLNQTALSYVTAPAQASAVTRILPLLSEEETAVYHRGRNMGHSGGPKHATVAQYRMATGFEALFGYLYLAGRQERIDELFNAAYGETENRKEEENEQSQD